ncbi:MAG: hypothetical protein K940chlam3_00113 [Chlamydiae bacterium]|nr:hypothetical protein [Chlamydiota bacterium]
MGTDIYSTIFVGEKVIKKTRKVPVKKYDPDTGEPYHKDDIEEFWVYESNQMPVSENMTLHDDSECEETISGFLVFKTGSHRCGVDFVIVEIATLQDKIEEYEKLTGRKATIFLNTEIS